MLEYLSGTGAPVRVRSFGISDDYVEHGNVEVLRREVGLDCETIAEQVKTEYQAIKRTDK